MSEFMETVLTLQENLFRLPAGDSRQEGLCGASKPKGASVKEACSR